MITAFVMKELKYVGKSRKFQKIPGEFGICHGEKWIRAAILYGFGKKTLVTPIF